MWAVCYSQFDRALMFGKIIREEKGIITIKDQRRTIDKESDWSEKNVDKFKSRSEAQKAFDATYRKR